MIDAHEAKLIDSCQRRAIREWTDIAGTTDSKISKVVNDQIRTMITVGKKLNKTDFPDPEFKED